MLSDRREIILRIIVSDYIASGTPVASQSIAPSPALDVSPATIRHEMACLEEEGYIARPHISAGSIPTSKGYRYYVESLLQQSKLSHEEQHTIQELFYQAEQELEEWARLASAFLSQRLQSIALVTLPRSQSCHFRHLDLIALQEANVLFVLLLLDGKIKQRLITLDKMYSQDELTATSNQLNTHFKSLTHTQISAHKFEASPVGEKITLTIVDVMSTEEKQRYDQFYLDGWRYLLSQPEFMKGSHTINLVEALEERSMLSSLLSSLGSESGVKVIIGNENKAEALQECSVILSNYGSRARGTIGVIGPTRMSYQKAIPIVDYLSLIMNSVIDELYT